MGVESKATGDSKLNVNPDNDQVPLRTATDGLISAPLNYLIDIVLFCLSYLQSILNGLTRTILVQLHYFC